MFRGRAAAPCRRHEQSTLLRAGATFYVSGGTLPASACGLVLTMGGSSRQSPAEPRSTNHNTAHPSQALSGKVPPTPAERPRRGLYRTFQRDTYAVVRSDDLPARATLYTVFSDSIAPALTDQLSYFEFLLAKLAQIWCPAGQRLSAFIVRGLQDEPCGGRWAAENQLTYIVGCREAPGFSLMFRPVAAASRQACALCFPGTAPSYRRDVLCARAYPRGVRDDLDPRGVGYEGFMHNRDIWLRQVHAVVADGRDLWLVGHSLGAAYASEMMAFVAERLPQYAQQVYLLSIYGPGLRLATLQALAPLRARIFRKTHRLDVTGWCGAGHPAAVVCRTCDCIGTSLVPFQVPHAVPQSSLRRLRGQAPRHRVRDEEACVHRLNVAEVLRLIAAWMCWRRLAA